MRIWQSAVAVGTTLAVVLCAVFCSAALAGTACAGCCTPTPDDWPTWGHDYNRTCVSTMAVDFCLMAPAWINQLPEWNSFCEPTIANDIVYISSDSRLSAFNLATGELLGQVTGLPYMFGSNRCNATIHGGKVYVTGGGANGFSRWNLTLTSADYVHSHAGPPPLLGRCRFGVTVVCDVGGTEILILGDEADYLYAFEAGNGALFTGWSVNPIHLDAAIYHSPSYDGTGLFVGTSDGPRGSGSIYRIDPATGAINWTFKSTAHPGHGYAGGVSLEGNYVYASGAGNDGAGHRVKLEKSTGNVVWEFTQEASLYSVPCIGPSFVYFAQDLGSGGILIVDKGTGAALCNYVVVGVGSVPQHLTLTCDGKLIAGDRSGRWWFLDANDPKVEGVTQFSGIVNGTALATHSNGDEYAVVGLRSHFGTGGVATFRLHQDPHASVTQYEFETTIPVEFGATSDNVHYLPDVIENTGCLDLNITAINLYEEGVAPIVLSCDESQSRNATALADAEVGPDYTSYFTPRKSWKGDKSEPTLRQSTDQELTVNDASCASGARAARGSWRRRQAVAAAASIMRTTSVSMRNPIRPFEKAYARWHWDGTGLERGIDVEVIEFVTDDPFRMMTGIHPTLKITYIGGCLDDQVELHWNTSATENIAGIYNDGFIGLRDDAGNLSWTGDPLSPHSIYYGTLVVAGDSSAAIGGAHMNMNWEYERVRSDGRFVPNPCPSDGLCGFEQETNVLMGLTHVGCGPIGPDSMFGEWVKTYYTDTNWSVPPESPMATFGVDFVQTDVGCYDPLYGDFRLIRWEFRNRDDVAKQFHAGTFVDWDVNSYRDNTGFASDLFNGYVYWDPTSPSMAYGMLDPNQPSTHTGVDPTAFPPHRISGSNYPLQPEGSYGPDDAVEQSWFNVVNRTPKRESAWPVQNDMYGTLINQPFTLPANGTHAIHQAMFAVDATSNDPAVIGVLAVDLARRAAVWGGFARGDVNQDSVINLVDVAFLLDCEQPIYPFDANGDVDCDGDLDTDDVQYLSNFVIGTGPAPIGKWRFDDLTPMPRACARCRHQADFDGNGVIDATDTSGEIDAVFFSGPNPRDSGCPAPRGDFNADGATDAIDLAAMIDHVFLGGPPPTDPM